MGVEEVSSQKTEWNSVSGHTRTRVSTAGPSTEFRRGDWAISVEGLSGFDRTGGKTAGAPEDRLNQQPLAEVRQAEFLPHRAGGFACGVVWQVGWPACPLH
jgi:hypothetical protein